MMECIRKQMHHRTHWNCVLTTEKHCNGSKPNQGHTKRQHSGEKKKKRAELETWENKLIINSS